MLDRAAECVGDGRAHRGENNLTGPVVDWVRLGEGECQDAQHAPAAAQRQSYPGLVARADEHLGGVRVFCRQVLGGWQVDGGGRGGCLPRRGGRRDRQRLPSGANGLREADLVQGHQQAWLLLTDQGQPGRRRAERQPVLEDGSSHLGQ